MSSFKNFIYS